VHEVVEKYGFTSVSTIASATHPTPPRGLPKGIDLYFDNVGATFSTRRWRTLHALAHRDVWASSVQRTERGGVTNTRCYHAPGQMKGSSSSTSRIVRRGAR